MAGKTAVELAGSRLGSYNLVRQLGEGGMGVVYEAEHRLLGRKVALKTIRRDIGSDPSLTRRILLEARAISALDHPGIVRLYDFGFEGSVPYMVMEWIPGRTLADLLAGGRRLQPRAAVRLLRPVAEALDHAHWSGVIHRDVKPANLLLADDGRVMVMDFGLAFVLHERAGTEPDSILGTADYMAPEQVAREPVQPASDVYSLSAVVFEAVTGRPPFLGSTWLEVAHKRLHEKPPLAVEIAPDVPGLFSERLTLGLDRDPARRPQSALELIELLNASLDAEEVRRDEKLRRLTGGRQVRAAHSGFRSVFARHAVGALAYLRYP